MGTSIFLGVLGLWLLTTIVIVRGKTAKVLETLGKPHEHALLPGLHFKYPLPITWVAGRVNLQLQEIGEDVSVKTQDNAFMVLPVKVQFRAVSTHKGAVLAHYELENPAQQITSYVLNNVRQTASSMDMAELYRNRDRIETEVQETLNERFSQFGYNIENVLVDEPQPSEEVRSAFNRVIASKRDREAAENIAAAKRIELVGIAEAEAESKRLQGEGMAAMRKAIAEGLEAAMRTMSGAGLSNEQALQLLMDTNRLDTLSGVASHGNLILADLAREQEGLMRNIASVRAAASQDRG